RAVKWVRRNALVSALVAAVMLVLVAGVVVSSYFAVKANHEATAARFEAFRAEDARHAIQIDLALRAWEQHDVARAEQVLGEVAPRFHQTWETRYLRGLCRRKPLSLQGHTAPVSSVCYSPDGKRVLSGSHDKTVKVWDAQTGQELLSLKGHT